MATICSEIEHHVRSEEQSCEQRGIDKEESKPVDSGNASPVTDGTRSMSSSSSASPTMKSYPRSPSPLLDSLNVTSITGLKQASGSIPIPTLSTSMTKITPVPDPIQPKAPAAVKWETTNRLNHPTQTQNNYAPKIINPRAQIAPSGGIRHNLSITQSENSVIFSNSSSMTPSSSISPPLNPILSSKCKSMPNFCANDLKRTLKTDLVQLQQKSPRLSAASEPRLARTYSFSVNDGKTVTKMMEKPTLSPSTLHDRRQKRLERNRESARLSRRRRKQYLEVLEERVTYLSEEMDRGRRHHVLDAVQTYKDLRQELVQNARKTIESTIVEKDVASMYDHYAHLLKTSLSRTSDELSLSTTFGREYLKSLILPHASKFVLWLTLQNDSYFRGGRSASERLSAARIGERMLSCANDKVPPANGMWPLFCNEVGLSYDQEERVRSLQRTILTSNESWLSRHVGSSSEHIIFSCHDAILGANITAKTRENAVYDILTTEQKLKFLIWLSNKERNTISKLSSHIASKLKIKTDSAQIQISGKHDAAIMYVVNHKLATLIKKFTETTPIVESSIILKKLSRRPSFESLATTNNEEDKNGNGSMKRCSSEISCDGMDKEKRGIIKKSSSGLSLSSNGQPTTTPETAQRSASHAVVVALGHVRSIIPPSLSQQRNQLQEDQGATISLTSSSKPTTRHLNTSHTPQPQETSDPSLQHMQYHSSSSKQSSLIPSTTISYSQENQPILETYACSGSETNMMRKDITETSTSASMFQQNFQNLRVDSANKPLNVLENLSHSNDSSSTTITQSNTTNQVPLVPILSSTQPYMDPPLKSMYPGLVEKNVESQMQINIVSEDGSLYNVPSKVADDSLLELTEEDWAIGEGFDMDIS